MAADWYIKRLKSPHWQRKRLEVMNRDNWKCVRCGNTEKELQVHHVYYERGKDPWDYPLEVFRTLCCDCHEEETSAINMLGAETIQRLRADRTLAIDLIDSMLAEYEDWLVQEHLNERDKRVAKLEGRGAVFDSNGRFFVLGGRAYDEDGDPL